MPVELATFLQPAVQPVFDKLFAMAEELLRTKLAGGGEVANTVKQWKQQLEIIEPLLVDAEHKVQIHSSNGRAVKAWLRKLQDVAYDMEDVLDHFAIQEHAKLLDAANHQQDDTGLIASTSNWICSLFNPVDPIDPSIQSQINDINERLTFLQEHIQILSLSVIDKPREAASIQTEDLRKLRETTRYQFEKEIVGRDSKKEEIMKLLLEDDQDNKENYAVIPIVGKGGVGKTTLAQYVYNDEHQLKDHFHIKAWVCVSDVFDVKQITTSIFNKVVATGQNVRDFNDVDDAQEKLEKQLKGKRFLIVLDDIWSDNYDLWVQLQTPFRNAAKGSRVMITTRNVNIARMMIDDPINTTIVKLEGLQDDDCWRVFEQHVYVDSDLFQMRHNIIEKCKGLPLAAKALGGLLRKTRDKGDRKRIILQSETWSEENNNVLPILRLSYGHLPSHLKRVFAYCSLFPKDYEFKEREVVLLWMAQGFLPENGRRSMEDIGHDYFCELVSRSLFEASQSSEEEFIMHDLIHDLALWAADGLCEVIDTTNTLQGLERTRHVFLMWNAATLVKQQLPGVSKWRTFHCLEAFELIEDLKFVQGFEYIRALCLASHYMEVLPEYLGDLKHMRFLRLDSRNIKELPNSMANLWNLQTLWLENCTNLQKLPSIRFLGKLRHLKIGTFSNLKEMPMGIGELTNLQSLDHFVLGDRGGERVRDLKNLNHLQGELTISGLESVLRVEDAKEAQLDKKDGLEELCLVWSDEREDVDDNTERDVLEQLKPHNSIKQLKLDGYRGLRFPYWLRSPCFSKMVDITLKSCDKCEYFPALGQLPSLKNLRIEAMHGIKNIIAEFYGCHKPSFPVLENLSFQRMNSWEKWVHSSAHDGAFPCLKELSIEECSALKELSPHLPSLKKLKIKECKEGLSVSLERLRLLEVLEVYKCGSIQFTSGFSSVVQAASFELAHLTKLTITNCSGRISLPGGLLLPAVKHVSFNDCEDLGSLPRELHNYTSLKKLTISNCKTMEELPIEGLPTNLEELAISVDVINQQQPKLVVDHLHSLRSLNLEDVPKLEDLCVPVSSLCHLYIRELNELKTISSSSNNTISNLTSLVVKECPSLVSLLPEEGLLLPAVERLVIRRCKNMERLPSELHRYTSLKQITISGCPKIEEIPRGGFPTNLEEITIEGVSNLQEVGVHHLHSLRYLILENVGMTTEDLSIPSSLSTLTISGILYGEHNLKSISSSTTEDSKLTYLKVCGCPKFKSLAGKFTFLSHLYIFECPEFQFPTEGGLPRNLTHLEVYGRMNGDKPIQEWGLHLLSSLQSLRLGKLGNSTITEAVECIPSPNLLLPSSLSELWVSGFQNLKTIDCSSFTHMKSLCISRCPKFQSFGDLRQKLPRVEIYSCESLKPHLKVDPDGPIHELVTLGAGCNYSLM